MQHICPQPHCDGLTFPQTAPVGNSAVHERMCRNCGFQYTFDPANVDEKKSGADFHLKAHAEAKAEAERLLEEPPEEEIVERAEEDAEPLDFEDYFGEGF